MENMNAEKNAGRKKLLVPLVVLIMCSIALTGAAYAYSASTVTVQNNTINGDYYSIDMYSSDAASTVITTPLAAGSDFKVYTTKTVGNDYIAKIDAGTFTRTTWVKVSSDIAGSKYTLTATVDMITKTLGIDATVTYGSVAMKNISQDDAPVTPGTTKVNVGDIIEVVVTFNVAESTNAGEYASVTALQNDVNAYNAKFNLTVNATLAA